MSGKDTRERAELANGKLNRRNMLVAGGRQRSDVRRSDGLAMDDGHPGS
jgi:hypothetical protein